MEREPFPPIRRVRCPRPQEEWKIIIAIYLYLAGMGAGSFMVGTVMDWFFRPSKWIPLPIENVSFDLAKAALLWGPLLVAIGAPFLILDLGIKRRFMYACLNPKTSWVARGFLILSVFIVFGFVLFIKSVLPVQWFYKESALWHILEAITFAFAFGTAIYTGILLKATKSIPLWNTHLLPLLFLVSALSTGSMAILLSTLWADLFSREAGPLNILMASEQILVVIEGILLYLYLKERYKVSEQGKDSVCLLLLGEKKILFWGGIVLLGFIFPITLENIASLFPQNGMLIISAGLTLLCGGFFLRLGILSAGIKEQFPMHRLMEIQYGLRTEKIKEN